MIRTVIFDIDDTLYDYTSANQIARETLAEYAVRELGMAAGEFLKLHDQTMNEQLKMLDDQAASHNRLIRFQMILEKLDLPIAPHALKMYDIYWNSLLDSAQISDGAMETIRELKERKIRIGIGTDMTSRMQYLKLERLNILPYIDFFVSSEEAGCEKPSGAFFELCVKKAGCEPSECLFLGDNFRKDVDGANRAGLHGVWYRPRGGEKAEVLEIGHFSGLFGVIGQIGQ